MDSDHTSSNSTSFPNDFKYSRSVKLTIKSKVRGNRSRSNTFYLPISILFAKAMDKLIDFTLYLFLIFCLINIKSPCINYKNRSSSETLKPFLMSLMNLS